MNKAEDMWFNKPNLNDSEMVELAYPANHTQNNWRAVGGKLFITNQRILFVPNKIDDKLGGEPVEITHDQVSAFFVKGKSISIKELFSGGLVDRLGIRLADGTEHSFVVNNLSETRSDIEEKLSNK